MRNKRYTVLALLILAIGMVVYLIYENETLKNQIEDQNVFIQKLLVKDSISSSLLPIEDKDSMIIVKYRTDDVGKKFSYDDLDSIRQFYKYQYDITDMVLVEAKHLYKFDYSVRDSSGTIKIGFWSKHE